MKMAKGGKEFNEIFDLTAMRVLVDSVKDCYGAIGIIHSLWKPMPGRFKDYVAMPKSNGYQSLHTTVIGPHGKAARDPGAHAGDAPDRRVRRRRPLAVQAPAGAGKDAAHRAGSRQLVDGRATRAIPKDFMDTLRVDLFDDEVFVFTPKGEVKALPAGATPLDFAYAVHTDVGHRCVGAKVNGRIVPLHYRLQSGEFVEILTSKPERGPVARLAALVEDVARAQQDPPVVRPASSARTSSRRGATRCSRRFRSRTGCRTRSSRRRRCWPS